MKRKRANLSPGVTAPAVAVARRTLVAVVLAGALGMTGCVGFEGRWRRSVQGTRTISVAGKSEAPAHLGAWEGTWTSRGTGHSGKLRCLVDAPAEGGPVVGRRVAGRRGEAGAREQAQAGFNYHATWSIFSGTFRTLQPYDQRSDGSVRSAGSWTLPKWAGGRYEYDIHIDGERFTGTWTGGGDSGEFDLRRVKK